MPLLLKKKL